MTDTVVDANRRTVREAFEAWQAGTGHPADLFAPEMTWRVEGRSRAAGDYADRQAFVEAVLVPFARRFEGGEPFRPTAIRSILADGDTVVVRWDGRGVARDGVAYENAYAWFMRMRDGRVVDGVAFFDSVAFDELWDRVRP